MGAVSAKAKAKLKANQKRYAQSARGKWSMHKAQAKARNILFDLSFEQWLGIWEASGKLDLRGRKPGQYQMSRVGDSGGYTVSNVVIKEVHSNLSEQLFSGKHVSRKLFPKDVLAIRSQWAAGVRQTVLAKQYGLSKNTVWRIIHGYRGNLLSTAKECD